MNIVTDWPPNIEEIDAVLGVRAWAKKNGFKPCFCWGSTIYNPLGWQIHPPIMVHEETHSEQTRAIGGPEKWWGVYLHDVQKRFDFELEAHRREYDKVRADFAGRGGLKRKALKEITARFLNPIYGYRPQIRLTFDQALREIRGSNGEAEPN